ncbi:glycoside hydrolase family 43 protein [Myceligenerans indicum]|uniref:Glycosyl hydrolase 43 family protein n=1 Tax=Myceligenerans indicum TaxID=2593663 RepID=A0ABS1LN90_9MICO|nr:glycoside hydrolase 43 family protein [Myceligenerans indicum]MBL0887554.1 glycosyl hydrolase 43 family protein [Myceligenerans indicum]
MADYENPVLDADWPDPDAIRVGDDFWMVASSFNRAPGLPVLHSRDLVAWEHVANALPAVPPREHYSLPRHGSGVWAPSLRYHDGRFVIVYPDPDHGIFVLTAADPRGPWSDPWCLLPGRGLIDPCPLWDDDGRAYLVHGWAASRAGIKNRLTVVEVDPGLRRVTGTPRIVVDGDALPGFGTLEGPKLYKRDGWYWIFAPAGGVATGWQTVFRSRSVWGPYEHRVVLEQGGTPVNGPHQGAWVDAPDGSDWFLHFQDRGPFGRVVHLQPMTWDGGWPQMGEALAVGPGPATGDGEPATDPASGRGRPVLRHPVPLPAVGAEQREPARSDDFSAPGLATRWHWQANPEPAWCVAAGGGSIHLPAQVAPLGNLREQGAVLCQQLPGRASTWTTRVTLRGEAPGLRAGLVLLGREYAWTGLLRTPAGVEVVCARSAPGGREEALGRAPAPATTLDLRIAVDDDGTARFSWRARSGADAQRGGASGRATSGDDSSDSHEGGPGNAAAGGTPTGDTVGSAIPGSGGTRGSDGTWHEFSALWTAMQGHWIGAEAGLFANAPLGAHVAEGDGATFGPVDVVVAGRSA